VSAREKHTINLVIVRSINHKMRRAKSFFEDYFSLVVSAKNNLVSMETAAFSQTGPDESNQVIV
jgi:predicted enzyme related to lactoylglutathione lyase